MSMNNSPSWFYRIVKAYFRFASDGIFYSRRYTVGADNIPPDGTPVLVAMNHQNAFNDALCLLFAKDDRKMHFIARADAFNINPLFTAFLNWAGVLPAFRLQYQGEEALANNGETFRKTEQNLLDGRTVLIFPEAGHQDKHWLGTFSYGYTRLAFEAAEQGNFQKEIFILPAANHYSAYTGLREQTMVQFGTPVSLQPYYELYKTHPRTAQREVNRQVREQIHSMMLDIRDLEHYADIDFLRQSGFGRAFAQSLDKDPEILPQKLEADQILVERLAARETDYSAVAAYRQALEAGKFQDEQLAEPAGWPITLLRCAVLVVLLPLAIVALWPSIPAWYIPKSFSDKMKDVMLQSTFQLAVNTLVFMPLAMIVTAIVSGLLLGWTFGIAHALSLPFLCIFEWHYSRLLKRSWADLRLTRSRAQALRALRKQAFEPLNSIIDNE